MPVRDPDLTADAEQLGDASRIISEDDNKLILALLPTLRELQRQHGHHATSTVEERFRRNADGPRSGECAGCQQTSANGQHPKLPPIQSMIRPAYPRANEAENTGNSGTSAANNSTYVEIPSEHLQLEQSATDQEEHEETAAKRRKNAGKRTSAAQERAQLTPSQKHTKNLNDMKSKYDALRTEHDRLCAKYEKVVDERHRSTEEVACLRRQNYELQIQLQRMDRLRSAASDVFQAFHQHSSAPVSHSGTTFTQLNCQMGKLQEAIAVASSTMASASQWPSTANVP
ncbi:hypothetical protein AAVH_21027 [Aphelenchoides avenae]|nr:hypothetical protein AAVH_21027 [Aphelenchus avenae]